MRKIFHFILIFIFASVMYACNSNTVYSEYISFENNQWSEAEPAEFNVNALDTINPFNIEIFINIYKEYPFRNMYLFLETFYPSGKISRDTLEFLFQNENGKYLGKCNSTSCNNEFLFKRNFQFTEGGVHQLKFIQAMRTENQVLPFVRKLGVKISKSQS